MKMLTVGFFHLNLLTKYTEYWIFRPHKVSAQLLMQMILLVKSVRLGQISRKAL